MLETLPTPTLLVDRERLVRNIQRMQSVCDAAGIALWPHIKTHKTIEIARLQREAGAAGLTCAKIGEAEALLPSGVRRFFIAYPLVDPLHGPRLRALREQLDELIVTVTSLAQAEALESLLAKVDLPLPIMMAIDTGLGREGVRTIPEATRLADFVEGSPHLELRGLFTHEGHSYRAEDPAKVAEEVCAHLAAVRAAIDPSLPLWPGSSPTAIHAASQTGIAAVRPGAYVFGDLSLIGPKGSMTEDDVALTVLTTVVDRPSPELALFDAGSKTLSSDHMADGRYAALADGRAIHVGKCSEEHGWAMGECVDTLRVGERVRLILAHVCPAVNLTDELVVIGPDSNVIDRWRVAARGKVQ